MTTLVMLGGRIVAPEAATVSVFDRGFLYGDAVFETIRTYGGVPFALDEHLERLRRSAESVFIELPISTSELAIEVTSAVVAAGNAESYVRVMLTRGQGESLGLDPGLARMPLRLVIVTPLVTPPESAYTEGIAVVTYPTQRISDWTEASSAKLANYLVAVLATRAARERGGAEALIVDREGQVLEGSTSNVFAFFGITLVTPPEELGILAGITRSHVLRVARDLGYDCELRALGARELGAADEVFITSSIREIMPVVMVDGAAIKTGRPGPMTLGLLKRFREKAAASAAKNRG